MIVIPKVHMCSERHCNKVIPFNKRYCPEHERLHNEEYYKKLSSKEIDRTEYYKNYNKNVRDPEANSFYNSTRWKHVAQYVRDRDMYMDGVTGKVLMDNDVIVDHCTPRRLCKDPYNTDNLWLLSRREHFRKTKLEEIISKQEHGDTKLQHLSKAWWKKILLEEPRKKDVNG